MYRSATGVQAIGLMTTSKADAARNMLAKPSKESSRRSHNIQSMSAIVSTPTYIYMSETLTMPKFNGKGMKNFLK